MLSRLAWLEIINNRRFFTLFILNLSLGLLGLVVVEGFRSQMQGLFQERSTEILGANLEISGRVSLSSEQVDQVLDELNLLVEGDIQVRRGWSMYNMMAYGSSSRLVHVKVFEKGYPFYGEIKANQKKGFDHYQDSASAVWIYPELESQMGIDLGENVEIGNEKFKVTGIVEHDPQQGFAGMSLAPRVFLSPESLDKAGLIQEGSVIWYSHYFSWPSMRELTSNQVLALEELLNEPALRVSTPSKSGEQMSRSFDYVSDFMGLVSLVSLFLASVGLVYLYQSFLLSKRKDMAIYLCLGYLPGQVFKIYIYQLLFLGFLGSLIGLLGGQSFLYLSQFYLTRLINLDITFTLFPDFLVLFKIFTVGVLGVLFVSIPLLRPIRDIRPSELIQEFRESDPLTFKTGFLKLLLWLPWLCFYFLLSVNVAHSWKVGGLFFLVFIIVPLFLFPILMWAFKALAILRERLSLIFRLTVLYISRFRVASTTAFLALSLAALLLNIIPMIQQGLILELLGPDNQKRPSLFLFDIQKNQIGDLKSFISDQEAEMIDLSPMVRGRLTRVNGEEFDHQRGRDVQTREAEQEVRFRNRGLNLTYRSELNTSEEIYRGKLFDGTFEWGRDEIAEVSVERRYAQRMGLELGDVIEVDILGLPVEAKITSLRRVSWTSFLPNFFLLFQPGLIDDAPKTFLSAIGPMQSHQIDDFQLSMFQLFPTISVIDTSRLVERLMNLMSQVGSALYIMSALSFFVGALVLFSVFRHQMEMKKRDVVLLKVLGLDDSRLRRIFRLEFVVLALFSSLLGAILGMGSSYLISTLFFDGTWVFNWRIPLVVSLGLISLCLAVSELAMKKVLQSPSKSILEE